jgi:hypothetical protein
VIGLNTNVLQRMKMMKIVKVYKSRMNKWIVQIKTGHWVWVPTGGDTAEISTSSLGWDFRLDNMESYGMEYIGTARVSISNFKVALVRGSSVPKCLYISSLIRG